MYRVDAESGTTVSETTGDTNYLSTSLIGGTSYIYRVTANTSAGEGPSANTTTTTPTGGKTVHTLAYSFTPVAATILLGQWHFCSPC